MDAVLGHESSFGRSFGRSFLGCFRSNFVGSFGGSPDLLGSSSENSFAISFRSMPATEKKHGVKKLLQKLPPGLLPKLFFCVVLPQIGLWANIPDSECIKSSLWNSFGSSFWGCFFRGLAAPPAASANSATFAPILITKLPQKLPPKLPLKLPPKLPSKLPPKLPTKVPTKLPPKLPPKLPQNWPKIFPDKFPSPMNRLRRSGPN